MGTITRNFANNLTTSGLLKATAFDNDSFDSVTSVPSGSVTTSDMQFISSVTASASASVEFTSGIDSTYSQYVFMFKNIHPASDSQFSFNVSSDGGSNYNVTKTTTFWRCEFKEDGSDSGLTYVSGYDVQGTGYHPLDGGVGNNSETSANGYLHLYAPSDTTFKKHFYAKTICRHESTPYYAIAGFSAGYMDTTSALNAVKFQMLSGNIDAGQILMYGII
jgi:hypothetical protein